MVGCITTLHEKHVDISYIHTVAEQLVIARGARLSPFIERYFLH